MFGGVEFGFVIELQLARDDDNEIWEYSPQSRYANRKGYPLHRYGSGRFCKFTAGTTVGAPGVYAVTSEQRLKYIGKCKSLKARFGSGGYANISPRNCFKGGQETNCRINALILAEAIGGKRIFLWFRKVPEPSVLEERLINDLDPPWNLRRPS